MRGSLCTSTGFDRVAACLLSVRDRTTIRFRAHDAGTLHDEPQFFFKTFYSKPWPAFYLLC